MRTQRMILLLPLLLLLAMCPAGAGQKQALVIGNGDYASARLKNPANDARDMAAKLRQLGFTVTELIDADQRKMEDAVRGFSRALGQDGVGLFYFAGHGIEVGGENYLIPVGADIQVEEDLRYKAVSAGRVLDGMRAAGNPMNLVILDACRDNPYARSFRSGGSRGLARMQAPEGSLVLYATQPGQVAADGQGRNGLFTEKLLASLDRPGLKAEEVFKQTALAVRDASGRKQTPWQEGVILGDFYFREPAGSPPDPGAEAAAQVNPPPLKPVPTQHPALEGKGYYVNHKYRYEISYPADRFVSQGESPSGDGQRFVVPNGRAELLVYAHYNILDQSLADSYREAQATAGRKTTYKVLKPGWFVVSGYEDGRIFYRKTLLREGTFFTFELHYDPADRALYDPLVPQIAAGFRIY